MCIICNMTDANGIEKADAFLSHFSDASEAMKRAREAMLEVSKVAHPDHRRQYDTFHKRLVHATREWNKLEQVREHQAPTTAP